MCNVYDYIDDDQGSRNPTKQHDYENQLKNSGPSQGKKESAKYFYPKSACPSKTKEKADSLDDQTMQEKSKWFPFWWTTDRKTMIIIILLILLMVMTVLVIALTAVFSTRNGNNDSDRSTVWTPWTSCSVSCISGIQQRIRLCTPSEKQNTSFCPNGWIEQTQNCVGSSCKCYEPYITLSENYRRESVPHDYTCDKNKIDGVSWYRFNLSTGENAVTEHCPEQKTCGTFGPIWLNGSHPTEYGLIQQVTMAASFDGSCFYIAGSARVTKCMVNGDVFFLYKLWKPTGCYRSYCTDKYQLEP